ncbi:glycolate oxidase FAD binding subunit [Oceanicella actignis]|uniref:Glycolate oxidase FAD binding subunit n=1 Tax=Oceanicella actignis TaxID=1189325 RepID=A0A1M7TKS7_9RHOB|nr:glycolate oxidase FAD binding subunit [Oceanicella actignis]SHN71344.1 glycolate oxidase FAD binding subunit [Oceanicella actignis]
MSAGAVPGAAEVLAPADEAELAAMVAAAAARRAPLRIRGGGTRLALGRPSQAAAELSVARLGGVRLYEPGALTIVAAAGATVAEIEATLAAERQILPFEPMDHRRLLGTDGEPTIGGAAAVNASGPRRVQAGACRDLMLGVRFVDGRGRVVKNGGRVMKNVTGYDLVKLMAGAHGTLGVLTEIAFKVLPAPECAATLWLEGLEDETAIRAMSAALTSPWDVSAAAHLSGGPTMIRLEGLEGSVRARAERLRERLAAFGDVETAEEGPLSWRDVRDCAPFAGRPGAVWRVAARPSMAAAAVARLRVERPVEALYDWGGGLIWLLTPEQDDAGAALVRAAAEAAQGHATLVRASDAVRAAVGAFHPRPGADALAAGLRARFDPAGVLNPGLMAS